MLKRTRALTVLAVVALLTVTAIVDLPASADGPVGPRPVRQLINQMANAVAGPDQGAQIHTIEISADGTRWTLDEGERPGQGASMPGPYSVQVSMEPPAHRAKQSYDLVSFGVFPRQITELFDDSGGYLIGQDNNFGGPIEAAMLSDREVSTRIHFQLMHPQGLVLDLARGEEEARLVGPVALRGEPHQLLVVDRGDLPPMRVFVADDTKLISRIDLLENDPLRRDAQVVVRYGDWRLHEESFRAPRRVKVFYDGELVQNETRTEVTINPEFPPGHFDPPAGVTPSPDPALAYRGATSHQHLQGFAALGFPLDGLQLDVQATTVTPGVHHITGGSHHSLLVEHDDGLILVDAPRSPERTQAIIDWAAATFPGQPLTHVVQSHFHVDHSIGVRTAVAAGADVATHRAARKFWGEIMRSPSTVVPDALAVSPRKPAFLTVGDGQSLSVGGGDNAVGLYPMPQDHAEDYVLVVAGGVAFVVDVYTPFPGAPIPPEGQAVIDFIDRLGLDVQWIAGGHGGFIAMPE